MRSPRAVALALSLAACGSRTELSDLPPGACVWTASAPRALSLGDRDRVPQAVRVLDDRLWVGHQPTIPNPPGSQPRFVQLVGAAGEPLEPAGRVLPSPDLFNNYNALSIWTDPVRRLHAAAAWTDRLGCQAVALDDDARPTGEPMRLDHNDCTAVVRRPDGWSFFTREFNASTRELDVFPRFHRVGLRGEVLSEEQLAPVAGTTADARHVYDDSSFVYAWAGATDGASRITIVVHDAQGRLTTPASSLDVARAGSVVQFIRVVPDGDTLLFAWFELVPRADSYDIVVARTSRTGAPMAAPRVVARPRFAFGNSPELGLAVARGVPAILWAPFPSATSGTLHLTTLDPRTLAPAPTVDVATALFPSTFFLRATSQGFVAVFTAIAPPARSQVWTAAWRCVVPG